MAMGIVSDDDFQAELARLNNTHLPNGVIQDKLAKGRKEGDNNIPDELRRVIGDSAIEEGSKETKPLARAFGVSDSSISAYKNGATSTTSYHSPNPELKEHIDNKKIKIAGLAKSRLLKAIKNITDEKLENSKATELASVAKDMSAVVKNMEPDKPVSVNNNGPTYVIYAPQIRKEESFDVIQLGE